MCVCFIVIHFLLWLLFDFSLLFDMSAFMHSCHQCVFFITLSCPTMLSAMLCLIFGMHPLDFIVHIHGRFPIGQIMASPTNPHRIELPYRPGARAPVSTKTKSSSRLSVLAMHCAVRATYGRPIPLDQEPGLQSAPGLRRAHDFWCSQCVARPSHLWSADHVLAIRAPTRTIQGLPTGV